MRANRSLFRRLIHTSYFTDRNFPPFSKVAHSNKMANIDLRTCSLPSCSAFPFRLYIFMYKHWHLGFPAAPKQLQLALKWICVTHLRQQQQQRQQQRQPHKQLQYIHPRDLWPGLWLYLRFSKFTLLCTIYFSAGIQFPFLAGIIVNYVARLWTGDIKNDTNISF